MPVPDDSRNQGPPSSAPRSRWPWQVAAVPARDAWRLMLGTWVVASPFSHRSSWRAFFHLVDSICHKSAVSRSHPEISHMSKQDSVNDPLPQCREVHWLSCAAPRNRNGHRMPMHEDLVLQAHLRGVLQVPHSQLEKRSFPTCMKQLPFPGLRTSGRNLLVNKSTLTAHGKQRMSTTSTLRRCKLHDSMLRYATHSSNILQPHFPEAEAVKDNLKPLLQMPE